MTCRAVIDFDLIENLSRLVGLGESIFIRCCLSTFTLLLHVTERGNVAADVSLSELLTDTGKIKSASLEPCLRIRSQLAPANTENGFLHRGLHLFCIQSDWLQCFALRLITCPACRLLNLERVGKSLGNLFHRLKKSPPGKGGLKVEGGSKWLGGMFLFQIRDGLLLVLDCQISVAGADVGGIRWPSFKCVSQLGSGEKPRQDLLDHLFAPADVLFGRGNG